MSEAEVKERRIFVFNKLKKGWKPKDIIEEIIDKYGLTENYANKFVYDLNKMYNESLKDISNDAASYCIGTLQGIICDSLEEKDRSNALKAIDILQKITKLTDNTQKVDLDIKFDFDS